VATWVSSWIPPGHTLHSLTPVEWFTVGQGCWGGSANPDGIWTPDSSSVQHLVRLWLLPPAAADVAVEQLSFSRHKRPDLIHVFICPRLMMQHWRKRLHKISDVLFNIPVGAQEDLWLADMHEPLVVGLILPFLSVSPWLRRYTPSVLDLECQLRRVWTSPEGDAGHLLRQFRL